MQEKQEVKGRSFLLGKTFWKHHKDEQIRKWMEVLINGIHFYFIFSPILPASCSYVITGKEMTLYLDIVPRMVVEMVVLEW